MEGTEPGTIIGQAPDVGSTIEPNGSMLVEVTVEPPPRWVSWSRRWSNPAAPRVGDAAARGAGPRLPGDRGGADPDEPDWISGLVWSQDPAPGTVVEPGAVVPPGGAVTP